MVQKARGNAGLIFPCYTSCMRKRNILIAAGVALSLIAACVIALMDRSSQYAARNELAQHLSSEPSVAPKMVHAQQAHNAPQPTVDNLIGAWGDGAPDPHVFEFRSDRTFAEKWGDRLQNYTVKCAQDTGKCSKPAYPSSATSTGLWSTVPLSQLSNEMVAIYADQPPVALSSLITNVIATGTVVLKLDQGESSAEYIGALLSEDGKMLTLYYLRGAPAYEQYTRVRLDQ